MSTWEPESDVDLTVSRTALRAMSAPPNEPTPTRGVVLEFNDGRRYLLVGRIAVGREPMADSQTLAVSVADITVSKTHLSVEPAPGAAWITDLNSRNGVALRLPDGDEISLRPGERTFAALGTRVDLGQSWFFLISDSEGLPPEPQRSSAAASEEEIARPDGLISDVPLN